MVDVGRAARHHVPPALPGGREVGLPGRGRTFIREAPGPDSAPTVVLLHGWSATADLNWHACFAPLAEHFRVVALDHRGHGRGLRAEDPFRLADCADDVAALVEQLRLGPVVAVGYSMGGPIAQLLWKRHPDVVAGLVLCATSCTFSGTLRESLLFGAAAGTSMLAGVVPLRPLADAVLGAVKRWQATRGGTWWGFDEIAGHDWSQIVEAGRELGRFDSRPWVGGIDVPTAVVVTEHDDVVPVERQEALAGRIARAAVHRVAGGHAVCTAAAQRFVPTLVHACRAVGADRSAAAA